jgi:soluble lytic murein transglycosylase-like protein
MERIVTGAFVRAAMGLAMAFSAAPAAADAAPDLAAVVAEAAQISGLPEGLLLAVIAAESGRDARAVSRAGALGLMQLMPRTWLQLRAALGLGSDPFDAHDNVVAGAVYLREMLDRFGPAGFLAAYNAGPARYAAHLDGRALLPRETAAYVARVRAALAGPHAFAPALTGWRASPLFPTTQRRSEDDFPMAR